MHVWSRLCLRWSQLVFGAHFDKLTPKVRAMRLLEEVIELAQAEDVEPDSVLTIFNQVYKKPKGTTWSEFGGVMATLATYAGTKGYDMDEAFWTEFMRIMHPDIMERVRTRNLEGDKIGIKENHIEQERRISANNPGDV